MKKYDVGFKLIMTAVWGFAGWVVWCLCSTVRSAVEPHRFFIFFDYMAVGGFVLIILTVWSQQLKKRRKHVLIAYVLLCTAIAAGGILTWKDKKAAVLNQNFDTKKYLPFHEDSKIVRLKDKSTLKLKDHLPVIDGAAALFPVYSAVANAVYPEDITLLDDEDEECVFVYNNTVEGYDALAEKNTDLFFGVYPSKQQLEWAKECGQEFKLTPIGKDGFIFFVNKDNPVSSLTTEQIKKIYSGDITNWKEVGGKNEKIAAYQRNENSGSQTAFLRFMEGEKIMKPPTDQVEDLMSGIIEEVADYENRTGSIGFSFRCYTEKMIANPQIKILSVDGIRPSKETIKNGTYPLTVYIYAVTRRADKKRNVKKLVDWMLSEQGQYIIDQTGYVPIK
ncbi:PstS family phosphate ABC transporter substrate-binding protein [Anaerostipes sp.]|uniref:PstS family phosphate ABC transporter substrate-binding protein n=1 Tax=Anaerostipes sp. TaxID=1872530 RepID=UPI0025BA89AE|nr:substrate-binding domain-containing protein [Anaerostipes sp.]MBS7009915.1 substrate-binding domain-containing protein [Anaerostipes sp.]